MQQPDQLTPNTPEKWYRNQYLLLFLAWLVVTLININKAFHIDDTFHLEAAKWIISHPFSPMSGTINWHWDLEPISKASQPPGYFYLVAIWGKLFGFTEIALHLMQSIFTALCIFFFFRMAKLFSAKNAVQLTILFVFNPAFIVNQNLMTDIPLLVVLLAFIYTLIKPEARSDASRYITASLLLSAGLLMKYSMLPLLPMLVFAIVQQKKYRYLFVVLIPLAFLGLWSAWNYYEFGAAHLLHRGSGTSFHEMTEKSNSLLLCLGAISFFPLFILRGIFPSSRLVSAVIVVASLALPALIVLVYTDVIPEVVANEILRNAFMANGKIILLLVCYCFVLYALKRVELKPVRVALAITYSWLAAVVLFMIMFAPSIASRHIVLLLPAILIVTSALLEKTPAYIRAIALTCTILSGIILGISDWQFADYYRRAAADVNKHVKAGKIWSAGHWGWQWYCTSNGVATLGLTTSTLHDGDYLVAPSHIAKQEIHKLNLTKVKSYWYQPGILSFFSVSKRAGFYATSRYEIPWTFSKEPVDTIVVYRIKGRN